MLGGASDMIKTVLSGIYDDAVLNQYRKSATRDPNTGNYERELVAPLDVKVQKDFCTMRQMQETGYTPHDVRFLVLTGAFTMSTLHELVYEGDTYQIESADSDPLKTHWDVRASKK